MLSISNLLDEDSIYYLKPKMDMFWQRIHNGNKSIFKKQMETILSIYGTKLSCNRFDVGNMIEYSISDYLCLIGYNSIETPNQIRFDIDVETVGQFSIKYSSGGDITLHNSNRHTNKDLLMKDTILITDKEWWLLVPALMDEYIMVIDYIKNKSDSLCLQRKIFKVLKNKNYPYWFQFEIENNKKECLHRPCSKDLYRMLFPKE